MTDVDTTDRSGVLHATGWLPICAALVAGTVGVLVWSPAGGVSLALITVTAGRLLSRWLAWPATDRRAALRHGVPAVVLAMGLVLSALVAAVTLTLAAEVPSTGLAAHGWRILLTPAGFVFGATMSVAAAYALRRPPPRAIGASLQRQRLDIPLAPQATLELRRRPRAGFRPSWPAMSSS